MFLFYQPLIQQGANFLDPEESRHAIQVLRLHERDSIQLIDGLGILYSAQITKADAKKCIFVITEKLVVAKRKQHVHIAIAPTKNIDRMEWFTEKAVEIGIDKITFMLCKNSERKAVNLERIQKIVISSLKQSQQAWLPTLSGIVPFTEILKEVATQKFIAHVDHQNTSQLKDVAKPNGNYLVLIGPEGDFRAEELADAKAIGFEKVSLGPNRLRTETAGLVACQTLQFVNG